MNRLPARIRESNLAAAAIVAVAFLALHVYAVGHYFARPPAPDISREVELGLTFRSLAATTADTLEYHFSRPAEEQSPLRAGLTPEREAEVLAEWHARNG